MTSFEYWSRMAPEGQFLCQVCFCCRPVAEAHEDENGDKWDECEACFFAEHAMKRIRDREEEIAELIDEVKNLDMDNAQLKIQVEFFRTAAENWQDGLDRQLVAVRDLTLELNHHKGMVTALRRDAELNEADIAQLQAENAELRKRLQPKPVREYTPPADDRDPECVQAWPGCFSGGYDPRCCRFPKSCSC